MENILYTKFSSQRKDEFKISTSIVENGMKKYIVKTALCGEARQHLKKMLINQEKLRGILEDSSIEIASCMKKDEDNVEIEFINGKTLESIINDKLINKQYKQVYSCLSKLSELLYNNSCISMFENSTGFNKIFGEIHFSHPLKAFELSNVDMIFSNFIIKDEKYTLIDYEWLFDFKVPIEFVLFRGLFHNIEVQKLKNEQKLELYNCMNINIEDIKIFEKMEVNFQNYVKGKDKDFTEIYHAINNQAIPLKCLNDESVSNNYALYIGSNRILQNRSFQTTIDIEINEFQYDFNIHDNFDIKLCLNDYNGIYKIDEAFGYSKGVKENLQVLDSNSDLEILNDYYFVHKKPYIIFKNKKYNSLKIRYKILSKNNNLMMNLVDILKKENSEKNENIQIKNFLVQKENEIEQYRLRAIEYEDAYDKSSKNNQNLTNMYEKLIMEYDELKKEYDIIDEELKYIHSKILWKVGTKLKSVVKGKRI